MTEKTALQILVAARAKIANPENWGKGIRGFGEGRRPLTTCCAAEAIEDSTAFGDESLLALRALVHACGLDFPRRFGSESLTQWNDAPERTHAEVLAAYDLAIATVRLS